MILKIILNKNICNLQINYKYNLNNLINFMLPDI